MSNANGKLNGTPLIDLHCHIIPRVDDGASDDNEALRMLHIAELDGISLIAATPHAHHCPAYKIAPGVQHLNELAAAAGLAIRVVPGCEVRLAANLPERYQSGHLQTLNGSRYLLLELYLDGGWPPSLPSVISELHAIGIRPILAHAERYQATKLNADPLYDLIAAGVPIQINASSLTNPMERGTQALAERLVRDRMAHILASDSHGANWRPPLLSAAAARVSELAGADYAAWMLGAAQQVVANTEFALPEPVRAPVAD